jgi:membrane fusion protein, macrolide-specific efflux system
MGIARKWVFPILRLLIFAVIALALVKIAFLPDGGTVSNPDKPSAEITEPQIAVATGTIKNNVSLSGTVAADAAVPIKASLAGEVKRLLVTQGQQVAVGTPILTLRSEQPSADGTSVVVKTATVVAPVAGTLSSFSALVGQQFAIGDAVGQIAPPTFHVSGSLAPEQLYRLQTKPTDAQVTITSGPAPFTCTGLTITSPLAGQDGSSGDGSSSGPVVSCAVPADVVVFAGLTAQLTIAGGIAENVLVVPITAVEGTSATGNVYFVLPDGSNEKRPVTLGLNDGTNVEVHTGLKEGDMILEFVPGALTPEPGFDSDGNPIPIDGSGCTVDKGGNTFCEGTNQ